MARQRLGKKKYKKCERITGREYIICLTRGGQTHYVAHCVSKCHEGHGCDYVNCRTGEYSLNDRDDLCPIIIPCKSREDIYPGNADNPSRMDHINKKIKEKERLLQEAVKERKRKPLKDSDLITVCAECLQAFYWHGEFMCGNAVNASTIGKIVGELKKLKDAHPNGWEHSDHWRNNFMVTSMI